MSENPTTILKIEIDGVEHDIGDTTARNALNNKQSTITANGLLKGDGAGGVTAAVAGTDYLTLSTLPKYDGTVVEGGGS